MPEYEVVFSLTKRVKAKTPEEAVLKAENDISEEVSCDNVYEIDDEQFIEKEVEGID